MKYKIFLVLFILLVIISPSVFAEQANNTVFIDSEVKDKLQGDDFVKVMVTMKVQKN